MVGSLASDVWLKSSASQGAAALCERYAGDTLYIPMERKRVAPLLHAKGASVREIAERLKTSPGYVRRILRTTPLHEGTMSATTTDTVNLSLPTEPAALARRIGELSRATALRDKGRETMGFQAIRRPGSFAPSGDRSSDGRP